MGANSTNKSFSVKKWAIVILLDVLILLAIVLFFLINRPFLHTKIQINGVYLDQPRNIDEFAMLDQHGNSFTKNQLKGHWTFLYFGFTHCPMICPTTLDTLNKMYLLLQKELPTKQLPQIIFITIDPTRDTIARLNQFINSFNSHFIALRADLNKSVDIEKKFSVSTIDLNNTLNHSTDIMLINPQAQIQAYFLYPPQAELMAQDYQTILHQTSNSKL